MPAPPIFFPCVPCPFRAGKPLLHPVAVEGSRLAWRFVVPWEAPHEDAPTVFAALSRVERVFGLLFFNEMRTQRSLDYTVIFGHLDSPHFQALSWLIQSEKPLTEVLPVVENWIAVMPGVLQQLSPEAFQALKQGILKALEPDLSDFNKMERYFAESLLHHRGNFRWGHARVAALKKLTESQLVHLLQTGLLPAARQSITFLAHCPAISPPLCQPACRPV